MHRNTKVLKALGGGAELLGIGRGNIAETAKSAPWMAT
jgi:hypothetical protein